MNNKKLFKHVKKDNDIILLSYKFRIYPTKDQKDKLLTQMKETNQCRNILVNYLSDRLKETYDDTLPTSVNKDTINPSKYITQLRKEGYFKNTSRTSLELTLKDLLVTYDNFYKHNLFHDNKGVDKYTIRSLKRRYGLPKHKQTKDRTHLKFQRTEVRFKMNGDHTTELDYDDYNCILDNPVLKLPNIDTMIKVKWSKHIPLSKTSVGNLCLTFKNNKFYIIIPVKLKKSEWVLLKKLRAAEIVTKSFKSKYHHNWSDFYTSYSGTGIDLGASNLTIQSDRGKVRGKYANDIKNIELVSSPKVVVKEHSKIKIVKFVENGTSLGFKDLLIKTNKHFLPNRISKLQTCLDARRNKYYESLGLSKNTKGYNTSFSIRKKADNFSKTLRLKNKITNYWEKVYNIRDNFIHQISTYYTRLYGWLGIEDLSVTTMVDKKYKKEANKELTPYMKVNSRITRSILNAGMYTCKEYLKYKGNLYSCLIVPVDPKYTSKTCNSCKTIVSKDMYNQIQKGNGINRRWICPTCNVENNRDINAAKNIRDRAVEYCNSYFKFNVEDEYVIA